MCGHQAEGLVPPAQVAELKIQESQNRTGVHKGLSSPQHMLPSIMAPSDSGAEQSSEGPLNR